MCVYVCVMRYTITKAADTVLPTLLKDSLIHIQVVDYEYDFLLLHSILHTIKNKIAYFQADIKFASTSCQMISSTDFPNLCNRIFLSRLKLL